MDCGCSIITWERVLAEPASISWEREAGAPSLITWERLCEVVIDLVPFNAADGVYLTSEGYTIIVKI